MKLTCKIPEPGTMGMIDIINDQDVRVAIVPNDVDGRKDAPVIVRAVNTHPDLLAACEQFRDIVNELGSCLTPEHESEVRQKLSYHTLQSYKLIAAAKGETL